VSRSRLTAFYATIFGSWHNGSLVRRGAQRLLIAGIVVAAGALVPLLATSAGAKTERAASTSYSDTTGDSGSAPDIKTVTVSDSGGTLTFLIQYANETCLSTPSYLYLGLDTDQNPNTGQPPIGADTVIQLNGDGSVSLGSHSCNGGDQITVTEAAAGVAGTSFNFGLESVNPPDFD
jgi:hypothetical protein